MILSAERLAESILEDEQGIHLLLWSDKEELIRALLVLSARLKAANLAFRSILLEGDSDAVQAALRAVYPVRFNEGESTETGPSRFLPVFFIQQGASAVAGPALNSMRAPLSEPPGSLIVVRHADHPGLLASAPDMYSLVGVNHASCEIFLSLWRLDSDAIPRSLDEETARATARLPGSSPGADEIDHWIRFDSDQAGMAAAS